MLSHKTKKTPNGVFFVLSMAWGSVFEPSFSFVPQTEIGCASATKVVGELAHQELVATHCQRQCILDPQMMLALCYIGRVCCLFPTLSCSALYLYEKPPISFLFYVFLSVFLYILGKM